MICFQTKRLIFRSWIDKDIEILQQINKNKKVMEYFPTPLTNEETIIFFNKINEELKVKNYGLFAVELKSNNKLIGFIGFHEFKQILDFGPSLELVWRLDSHYWNQGLATEGALACIEYAKQLGFKELYAFTAKVNIPSQRVMEKLGMKYIKRFDHPKVDNKSVLMEHVLYKIYL